MRTIRFSFILPVLQLSLALALWEWEGRLHLRHLGPGQYSAGPHVCFGIDAPAIFLRFVVFPFTRDHPFWPQVSAFGYGLEDLSFFLGVVILWFLIGRWFDRWRLNKDWLEPKMTVRGVLVGLWLIALGLFMGIGLLLEGVEGLRRPFNWGDYWGTIIESTLFLVWSVVLIFFSGRKLKSVIGRVFQR
jgi:hypothetical protein